VAWLLYFALAACCVGGGVWWYGSDARRRRSRSRSKVASRRGRQRSHGGGSRPSFEAASYSRRDQSTRDQYAGEMKSLAHDEHDEGHGAI